MPGSRSSASGSASRCTSLLHRGWTGHSSCTATKAAYWLEPSWTQAALRFVGDGFRHILDGTDHLLFIAALVIPVRRLAPLVGIVTAFTAAHSLTLAASVLGWAPDGLWFPPLVETLIAASIVFMALENMLGLSGSSGAPPRRWIVAFLFGLVHGFGFAFALRESLQFAGDHLLLALLSFNVGVELGQVAVLLVLAPVLTLVMRRLPERAMVLVLSALIAHTAWHWLAERWDQLSRFSWPVADVTALPSLLRWTAAAIATGFLLYAIDGWLQRRRRFPPRLGTVDDRQRLRLRSASSTVP